MRASTISFACCVVIALGATVGAMGAMRSTGWQAWSYGISAAVNIAALAIALAMAIELRRRRL